MKRMIPRIGFVLVLMVSLLFAECSIVPTQSPAQSPTLSSTQTPPAVQPTETLATTVPEEYRHIYEEIDAALTHFERNLCQKGTRRQGKTVFATELAFANGNIGEGLLLPQIFDYN